MRLPKIADYATCAVNSVACPVGSANEIEQPGIFPGVIAYRPVQPCVETRAGNTQNSAHQGDRVFVTVLVHEAVLHSGSLAKYRAAFFKRSRSSSTRRSCDRRRRISLLASSRSFDCCSDLSGDTALTHL